MDIPYMERTSFGNKMGISRNGIALNNGLHMFSTNADAHAYLSRTKG